ncbi:YbhB/YbcL family Raf kinase inhibitor-like protein [Qipengyuania sp. DSG2-2]|uniref:YbhB/YbcL family Raf kinase inhibitor-like protein n=1 Tax=Qipengyuania sp. DGS2-2 TaxID=3349631 RepID=UPI0036D2C38C
MADWLDSVLPKDCPRNSGLAIARLTEEKRIGRGGLTLTSPAFAPGGELDPCFTADEEDAVAPPMEWTAPPPGTQEMVLIVEDASVSPPTLHWSVWGLAGQRGKLLEGEVPPRVGKNAKQNSEWLLPAQSEEDGTHHFVFQLFALELPLTLMPGASAKDVFAAIEGQVSAAAVLTATYRSAGDGADDWEDEDDID